MSVILRLYLVGAAVLVVFGARAAIRRDRETMTRLRTLAAIWTVLVVVIWAGKWAVSLLAAAVAVLVLDELGILREDRRRWIAGAGWALACAIAALPLAPLPALAIGCAAPSAIAFAVMILGMRGGAAAGEPAQGAPAPIAGVVVFAAAVHVACGLAAAGGVCRMGPERLLGLILLLQFNDGFAYVAGRAFGRTKLAPTISPRKSVEGAIGGMIGAGALTMLLRTRVLPVFAGLPWIHAVGLWIVVVALGIAGDLAYSLAKRRAGIKDFSARLPGHGGVLDRLDSLITVLPAALAWTLCWSRTP